MGENRCGVQTRKCFIAIITLAAFRYSLPVLKIYSIRYVKKNFDKNFEMALLFKFNKYI